MAIKFHCEHCGKKISAPEDAGGKPGKCPSCHQRVFIPLPESEIEEIPLAPEDPQDEIRRQQLLREQFLLQEELEKHKGAPEVPGGQEPPIIPETALPLTDEGDGAALHLSAGPNLKQLIESYVLHMARGNLETAEQTAAQIVARGPKAQREVEQMAMQEFFHPDLPNIPASVVSSFFKKLLGKF